MKTSVRPLRILAVLIAFVFSMMFSGVVYAGTSSTSGGVDSAHCTASKTITQSSTYWTAYVTSQCDLGIGRIGYTWWTVRVWCQAQSKYIWQYNAPSGVVNYNSNYLQRAKSNNPYSACSSTPLLEDAGQHDFATVTPSTWQPTVIRSEGRQQVEQ